MIYNIIYNIIYIIYNMILFEVWRSSRSGINLLGGVVKLFNTQKETDRCSPIGHQQNAALFHFKLSRFYIHQISPLHGGLSHSPP